MIRMIPCLMIAFVFMFSAQDALAQNAFNKAQAIVQNVNDKIEGVEQEDGEVKNQVMQVKEAVSPMVEGAKSVADKVSDVANKAAAAIKDPKGAFMTAVESVASKTEDMSLADDLIKDGVYKKNITPKEYKEKIQKDQEEYNDAVAFLYGAALAHRKKLLKEIMEDKPLETTSVNDSLKMTNAKVKEIVSRFGYMQMMEAKTDELDYQQKMISFRVDDKEGAE